MEENNNIKCTSCGNESNQRINVSRFISSLDKFFETNDLEGAKKHLEFWENDARNMGDNCGLLTVLNEKIGFSRRINDDQMGLKAVEEAKVLLETNKQLDNPSGATVMVNIATTLNCFGKCREAIPVYERAKAVYLDYKLDTTYEYAALLNNISTTYTNLQLYDDAEKCINEAILILEKDGKHDAEIAVSLINLAHLYFDRDEDYERVEKTLDKVWEYVNSPRQARDANYAYVLSKIAPSLRYFKREMEAECLEEVVKEIYGGNHE